jgi:seryl-tRNA synthetase
MLDIQELRKDLETVVAQLKSRKFDFDTAKFTALETERKAVQTRTQELQAKRNSASKQIGIAKSKGEDASAIMQEVAGLGDELKADEARLLEIQTELQEILLNVPNLPHESVPVGVSEEDNVEVRKVGTPRTFDFDIKDHTDVGTPLGLDFDTGAKLSGARFTLMRGQIAKLHRALAQFMLDTQTEQHGYTECYTPYMVNAETLIGTGQLPKFEEDLFSLNHNDSKLYLIPTSEVTLTNTVRDEIVAVDDLPIKLTAHTPCFRSEAGSYGRDTKGMIRQHQFDKVEMVQIVHPETSYEALDEMVGHAESILKAL